MAKSKILYSLIILFTLTSCWTKRAVVTDVRREVTEKHDTTIIVKHDTVKIESVSTQRDSIWSEHIYNIVLNDKGDTIKSTEKHNTFHGVTKNDSTTYYKSLYDSLLNVRNSSNITTHEKEKEVVIEKKNWLDNIVSRFFFIVLVIIILGYIWKKCS